MTPQELADIKARYEATSVAPWVASVEGRDHEPGGSSFIMTGIPKGEYIWQEKRGEDLEIIGATIADLDFIAHARQDIPMLLAEIERLQNVLQEKNVVGIPINADDTFDEFIEHIETETNQKIEFVIKEWEVLFAQVDVSPFNATQIFNWGRLFDYMNNKTKKTINKYI